MDKLKSILNHYITRYFISVFFVLTGFTLKGSTIADIAGFVLMVIGWGIIYSAFQDSYLLRKAMEELYAEKEQE